MVLIQQGNPLRIRFMYIITPGVTIKTNKQKYKEIYPNTQQNSKKSSDNSEEGKKEGN